MYLEYILMYVTYVFEMYVTYVFEMYVTYVFALLIWGTHKRYVPRIHTCQ